MYVTSIERFTFPFYRVEHFSSINSRTDSYNIFSAYFSQILASNQSQNETVDNLFHDSWYDFR